MALFGAFAGILALVSWIIALVLVIQLYRFLWLGIRYYERELYGKHKKGK